ncbi:MAG TPA: protein tyrosine phosphatase family protein [Thermoanaerobaculia bacterium]|nr:protein tyrosine phosphatase family protein [Thermoanaerobaculia bacterium]
MKTALALTLFLFAPSLSADQAAPAAPTVAMANASQPQPWLEAAGQPTPEQLAEVAKAGYKTVIDLRLPSEERGFDEPAKVAELGMAYVNIPITSDTLDAAALARFREELAKAEKPVLLHCAAANRVGALYYGYLRLDLGLPAEAALAQARAAGLKNEALATKVEGLLPKP